MVGFAEPVRAVREGPLLLFEGADIKVAERFGWWTCDGDPRGGPEAETLERSWWVALLAGVCASDLGMVGRGSWLLDEASRDGDEVVVVVLVVEGGGGCESRVTIGW